MDPRDTIERMPARPSIARSLGRFFGELTRAVQTPVSGGEPTRREVSRTTEQRVEQTEAGPIVLRRTIVEEVEWRPEPPRDPQ